MLCSYFLKSHGKEELTSLEIFTSFLGLFPILVHLLSFGFLEMFITTSYERSSSSLDVALSEHIKQCHHQMITHGQCHGNAGRDEHLSSSAG